MNKIGIIKEIRDVVEGNSACEYIAVDKRGRGYELKACGLGRPVRENFGVGDMLFRHTRNSCTLSEAEELLNNQQVEVEWRLKAMERAIKGEIDY